MTDTASTRCSICLHPQLAELDKALLEGVELREIRALVGPLNDSISTSALSRHATAHLQPELRQAAQDTEAAPTDLLIRLVAVADSARASRLRAESTGTPVQLTRASDLEVKVLGTLLGMYGINDTSVVAAMSDAEKLVRAVGGFAVAHPKAAQALIQEINKQGLDDFGQQLEEIVQKKNSQHHTIEGTTK